MIGALVSLVALAVPPSAPRTLELSLDNEGISGPVSDLTVFVPAAELPWQGEGLAFFDADGAELPFEASASGSGLWVLVPRVPPPPEPLVLALHLGDFPSRSWSGSEVWPGARAVYHLDERTGDPPRDVVRGESGPLPVESAPGVLDGAHDAQAGFIEAVASVTSPVTISAWIRLPSPDNILMDGYWWWVRSCSEGLSLEIWNEGVGTYMSCVPLALSGWHQVTVEIDEVSQSLWVDGAWLTAFDTLASPSTAVFSFGGSAYPDFETSDALVDEIRIYDTLRSADWLMLDRRSVAGAMVRSVVPAEETTADRTTPTETTSTGTAPEDEPTIRFTSGRCGCDTRAPASGGGLAWLAWLAWSRLRGAAPRAAERPTRTGPSRRRPSASRHLRWTRRSPPRQP